MNSEEGRERSNGTGKDLYIYRGSEPPSHQPGATRYFGLLHSISKTKCTLLHKAAVLGHCRTTVHWKYVREYFRTSPLYYNSELCTPPIPPPTNTTAATRQRVGIKLVFRSCAMQAPLCYLYTTSLIVHITRILNKPYPIPK